MADIAPLRPLRYAAAADLASLICPPYDVIAPAERDALAARSPHNVVRLELPEGEGDARYEAAADLLRGWTESRVLFRADVPAFYRYAQTFDAPAWAPRAGHGHAVTRRGFFALVRAVPFGEGSVLPHERTLSGPKEDRLKLARATRVQVSPGFMLYADAARALEAPLGSGTPLAEFETAEGAGGAVRHRLDRVDDPKAIAAIAGFLSERSLLVADGHHRYETSLRYAALADEERREAGLPPAPARAEHRWYMVFLCNSDDPGLIVFPTHRLVHSVQGFDWDALLARAADLFAVVPASGPPDAAAIASRLADVGAATNAFAVVGPDGRVAYLGLRRDVDLAAHPALRDRHPSVRGTDVAVLHGLVLEGLLGISLDAQARKTNLQYLQDPRDGFAAVQRGDAQVLFVMNPTPVAQVRAAAEAGEVMPQKSTYFYPKVPTGIVLHTLDPDRSV